MCGHSNPARASRSRARNRASLLLAGALYGATASSGCGAGTDHLRAPEPDGPCRTLRGVPAEARERIPGRDVSVDLDSTPDSLHEVVGGHGCETWIGLRAYRPPARPAGFTVEATYFEPGEVRRRYGQAASLLAATELALEALRDSRPEVFVVVDTWLESDAHAAVDGASRALSERYLLVTGPPGGGSGGASSHRLLGEADAVLVVRTRPAIDGRRAVHLRWMTPEGESEAYSFVPPERLEAAVVRFARDSIPEFSPPP